VARPLLLRGLGWLHSFEYEEAAKNFGEAAAADPRCGIAHWGAAMTYYHPLWVPPTPSELAQGSAADAGRLGHGTRVLAYTAAMEQLHARYPDDLEIAVFYSLALIAAGTLDGDPGFERERKAGAILNAAYLKEPEHPGIAHYLIHSFDYPSLAQLALPAARRYAQIAPSSAHAQHMPSHIFTRLGMWDEAIKSNVAAEVAARGYAQSHGLTGSWDERLHAMDYLAYAYLQLGRDRDAQGVMNELGAIERVDPTNFKVAYTVTAVPARLALERRNWQEAASLELTPRLRGLAPLDKMQWAEAHVHFARAVGAARLGDAAAARREIDALSSIERTLVVPPGTYDWRKQVAIETQIAQAWLTNLEGRSEEAVRLMRAAAELDDATEKHPVTPGSILPAREQLGELLLETGHPREALTEFEASLKRTPRRLAGIYGAARSARQAGDQAAATRHFAELVTLTRSGDASRAEIKEARAYIGGTPGR